MLRQIIFFKVSLGSKAIDWDFQKVKYLDEHVEQCGGRKGGVENQNSKKGIEKNEHACSVEQYGG